MKHIRKFETTTGFEAERSSLALPNVSLVTQTNTINYLPYGGGTVEPTFLGIRVKDSIMCPEEYLYNSYHIGLQHYSGDGETIVYVDFDRVPTTETLNAVSLYPVIGEWEPTKAITGNSIVITCPESIRRVSAYDIMVGNRVFTVTTYGDSPYYQFGVYDHNTIIWPT